MSVTCEEKDFLVLLVTSVVANGMRLTECLPSPDDIMQTKSHKAPEATCCTRIRSQRSCGEQKV